VLLFQTIFKYQSKIVHYMTCQMRVSRRY